MKPEKMTIAKDNYRIESVFKVLFFRDDMIIQLTEKDSTSSYLHIRSASRVGESDLGVNRRRVKTFFDELNNCL